MMDNWSEGILSLIQPHKADSQVTCQPHSSQPSTLAGNLDKEIGTEIFWLVKKFFIVLHEN